MFLFFINKSNTSCFFFFFSSRRRHTRYWRDWSSDVCSSDLPPGQPARRVVAGGKECQLQGGEPVGLGQGGVAGAERGGVHLGGDVRAGRGGEDDRGDLVGVVGGHGTGDEVAERV